MCKVHKRFEIKTFKSKQKSNLELLIIMLLSDLLHKDLLTSSAFLIQSYFDNFQNKKMDSSKKKNWD